MTTDETNDKRDDATLENSQVEDSSDEEETEEEEKWIVENILDGYGDADQYSCMDEEFDSMEDAIEAAESEIEDVHNWNDEGDEWSKREITAHCSYRVCRADDETEYHDGEYVVERDENELAPSSNGYGEDECYKHTWKGVGGIDSNPGVWGGPGTEMSFDQECDDCKMSRIVVRLGSQRNPGAEDYVQYYRAPEVDEEEEVEEEEEP